MGYEIWNSIGRGFLTLLTLAFFVLYFRNIYIVVKNVRNEDYYNLTFAARALGVVVPILGAFMGLV
jgi:hypothetical protein